MAEPSGQQRTDTMPRRRISPSSIDIPLEDDTTQWNHRQAKKRTQGLSRKRPSHIRTPDEVLTGMLEASDTSDTYATVPEETSEVLDRVLNSQIILDTDVEVAGERTELSSSALPENAVGLVTDPEPKSDPAEEEEIKRQVSQEIESNVAAGIGETYNYPPFSLLKEGIKESNRGINAELKLNANRLTDTIKSFGIEARLINITRGPSVTRFELEMDRGIKLNKLTGLADDIALSLGATGVRIAPIPDKVAVVGIEVPNKTVSIVHLREVLESKEFISSESKVSFAVARI